MDDRSQRYQKQKPPNTTQKTQTSGSNKSNTNNNTTTARASIFGDGTNNNNNNNNNNNTNLVNKAARFFSSRNSIRSDEQQSQPSNIMNKFQSLNRKLPFSSLQNIMSRRDRAAPTPSLAANGDERKEDLESQRAAIIAKMEKLQNQITSLETDFMRPTGVMSTTGVISATKKTHFSATVPAKGLERVEIINPRTGKLTSVIYKHQLDLPQFNPNTRKFEYVAQIPLEYDGYIVRGKTSDPGAPASFQTRGKTSRKTGRNTRGNTRGKHSTRIRPSRLSKSRWVTTVQNVNLTDDIVGKSYKLRNKSRKLSNMAQAQSRNNDIGAEQSYVLCLNSFMVKILDVLFLGFVVVVVLVLEFTHKVQSSYQGGIVNVDTHKNTKYDLNKLDMNVLNEIKVCMLISHTFLTPVYFCVFFG